MRRAVYVRPGGGRGQESNETDLDYRRRIHAEANAPKVKNRSGAAASPEASLPAKKGKPSIAHRSAIKLASHNGSSASRDSQGGSAKGSKDYSWGAKVETLVSTSTPHTRHDTGHAMGVDGPRAKDTMTAVGRPRRASKLINYSESALLEQQRPIYRNWKGEVGQDPTETGDQYLARMYPKAAAAAAARLAGVKARAAVVAAEEAATTPEHTHTRVAPGAMAAAPCVADPGKHARVAGAHYTRKRRFSDNNQTVVDIWSGIRWHCAHGRERSKCKACGGAEAADPAAHVQGGSERTHKRACGGQADDSGSAARPGTVAGSAVQG